MSCWPTPYTRPELRACLNFGFHSFWAKLGCLSCGTMPVVWNVTRPGHLCTVYEANIQSYSTFHYSCLWRDRGRSVYEWTDGWMDGWMDEISVREWLQGLWLDFDPQLLNIRACPGFQSLLHCKKVRVSLLSPLKLSFFLGTHWLLSHKN